MPTYDYRCTNEECGELREDVANMREFKEHAPPCLVCASPCKYEYNPTVPHAVFKDGPSGSWPSKGERIKKQRQEASDAAAKRSVDRYGKNPNRLVPNYDGKETGTWAEAQNLASKERGAPSAATFETKVAAEKSLETKIVSVPKT